MYTKRVVIAQLLALCALLGYAQEHERAKTNTAEKVPLAANATSHEPWEGFQSPKSERAGTIKAVAPKPPTWETKPFSPPPLWTREWVDSTNFITLKAKAEKGEAEALFGLGEVWEARARVFTEDEVLGSVECRERQRTNWVEAVNWYRKAAEAGHIRAQVALGWMHCRGKGVGTNASEAVKWFEKAAANNSWLGCMSLAEIYALGFFGQADETKADKFYQKALEAAKANPTNTSRIYLADGNDTGEVYEMPNKNVRAICGSIGCKLLNQSKETFLSDTVLKWLRRAAESNCLGEIWGFANAFLDGGEENGVRCVKDAKKTFLLWKFLAEHGDAEGQASLGTAYLRGIGVQSNAVEASTWYRKAAGQSNTWAQSKLALMYSWGLGVESNAVEAIKWMLMAAEGGNTWAQYNLGLRYAKGQGVTKNQQKATDWYRKAAEKGFFSAQTELGRMYMVGDGVEADQYEAAKWFRMAAEQDVTDAQLQLARILSWGTNRTDLAESVAWWRKAAEAGDGEAQSELGEVYCDGTGVAKNIDEAIKWFQKAVDQGRYEGWMGLAKVNALGLRGQTDDLEADKCYQRALEAARTSSAENISQEMAEMNIGNSSAWIACSLLNQAQQPVLTEVMKKWLNRATETDKIGITFKDHRGAVQNRITDFWRGTRGITKNPVKAFSLLKFCAEKGDPRDEIDLGGAYADGDGTPKDTIMAFSWFKKAAEQGNSYGQFDTGLCCLKGEGTPRDYTEAYKWFNLAAAQGFASAAEARDNLTRWMTPEQIAEAQRRSSAFVARKEKGFSAGKEDVPDRAEARFVGTGFFASEDGYLVTCQHLLADAKAIKVQTRNGTFTARLLKSDSANDVAVLKVTGQFPSMPLATSRAVKLGDSIFTVGFPNPALQGTLPKLTKGEVSSLAGIQDDPRYFQISAAIQPGNSGGALVDAAGNVVGLVTAKLSVRAALATSGALPENVNYAVKSTYLLGLLESLPDTASKLREPHASKSRKWEDVVKEAEEATVMVLVY